MKTNKRNKNKRTANEQNINKIYAMTQRIANT